MCPAVLTRSVVRYGLILGFELTWPAWAGNAFDNTQTVVVTANRTNEDIQAVPVDV